MKKIIPFLTALIFSSIMAFGSPEYTVFQSQTLSVKGEKDRTLDLLSEVAYVNGTNLNQIFTFYNPNQKEDYNASFGIMPVTSSGKEVDYPLPFTFTILVNGHIMDYSVKINGRTLKNTDRISGMFKSGSYIPVYFTIPADKKQNVSVQIKYNFLECSESVQDFDFTYSFSTRLERYSDTLFKLFFINPEMTYFLQNMELPQWTYISKTDENEWTFDFDSEYLKNEEKNIKLSFKKFPRYTDRELAFNLVDDDSLFFLTYNQLRSITELYRLYFYQLTELQNSNVAKINSYANMEYPSYYRSFLPGRWVELEQERLAAIAEAEAKAKAEAEAKAKKLEEEEKAEKALRKEAEKNKKSQPEKAE